MARINLNICLSDIPKDLIRRAGNGKAYINLNVGELRETDERGNDHYISVFVPQERLDDYPEKIYIGRGREYKEQPHVGGTPFTKQEPPQAEINEQTDLPF